MRCLQAAAPSFRGRNQAASLSLRKSLKLQLYVARTPRSTPGPICPVDQTRRVEWRTICGLFLFQTAHGIFRGLAGGTQGAAAMAADAGRHGGRGRRRGRQQQRRQPDGARGCALKSQRLAHHVTVPGAAPSASSRPGLLSHLSKQTTVALSRPVPVPRLSSRKHVTHGQPVLIPCEPCLQRTEAVLQGRCALGAAAPTQGSCWACCWRIPVVPVQSPVNGFCLDSARKQRRRWCTWGPLGRTGQLPGLLSSRAHLVLSRFFTFWSSGGLFASHMCSQGGVPGAPGAGGPAAGPAGRAAPRLAAHGHGRRGGSGCGEPLLFSALFVCRPHPCVSLREP